MAKLPSVENFNAAIPQSNRGIVSYNPNIVNNVTKTLGDKAVQTGVAMADAQDKLALAQAKSLMLRSDIEVRSSLENDNEYGTWQPRYQEGMKQRMNDIGSTLPPVQKAEFLLDAGDTISKGNYNLGEKKDKRHLQVMGANSYKAIDAQASSATLDTMDQSIANIKDIANSFASIPGANSQSAFKNSKTAIRGMVDNTYASLTPEQRTSLSQPKYSGEAGSDLQKLAQYGSTYSGGKLSPAFVASLAHAESGGSANAKSSVPGSTAGGMFGWTKGSARARGLDYKRLITDPKYAAEASIDYAIDNRKTMESQLKKPISEPELMLAHMGAGNAIALLKPENQDKLAIDVLQPQEGKTPEWVVTHNGGTADMTAKKFANIRLSKYRGLSDNAPGLVEVGNIDVNNRPEVKNADGTISTLLSMSREEDGKEVLVPQVVDGKILNEDEAWKHYKETGEHLGKFDSSYAADAYAEDLHQAQAKAHPVFNTTGSWVDQVSPKLKASLAQKDNLILAKTKLATDVQANTDKIMELYDTDQQSAYNAAKSISDPMIRDETIKALDKEFTRAKTNDIRKYEDNLAKAITLVKNDKTTVQDLPPEITLGMAQKDMDALDYYEKKQDGRAAEIGMAPRMANDAGPQPLVPTMRLFHDNGEQEFYNNVIGDYVNNPYTITKYSQAEILAYAPADKQEKLLKYRKDVMAGASLPEAGEAIRTQLLADYDTTGDGLTYRMAFDLRVAHEEAAKGKKLSVLELQKVKQHLDIELAFDTGWFGETKKIGELTEELTADQRKTIEVPALDWKDITDEYGKDLKEQEVRDIYIQRLGL